MKDSKGHVILVHGFNEWGEHKLFRLGRYFEEAGYQVHEFDYGWVGLCGVRLGNHRRADRLADLTCELTWVPYGEMIGVGYSNGAAICHLASHQRYPARFTRLIYLHSALDRDAPLAPRIKRLDVWHTKHDKPTKWARWLPWHVWGAMGAVGYQGEADERITNHDMSAAPHTVGTHGGVFEEPMLSHYGPLIAGEETDEEE